MIKSLFLLFFISTSAFAYVPTVESLFRHGSNPDLTANGVAITFSVKKIDASNKSSSGETSLLDEGKSNDFYKIFYTRLGDSMKVAQTRYDNSSFSEASLLEKIYFSGFSSYTLKANPEESEKGIFQGLLRSILFNDGAFFVNYLKALGVPVKLNNEIINRQKVESLANYKQYLLTINKDRSARKTEANPLKPEDAAARDRMDNIMNEPMYMDQKQVKLSRENGEMAWLITAGSFEAVVSDKERDILRVKFKSQLGEYEIICKDYWLANGTHSVPRFMIIRDYKGESYQVEMMNLKHFQEKEIDLINRLKKWDGILKGKVSHDAKPPFIL